ncbi:MAG: response regulator [Alphaproteobacteria bacterium]|nr:response regulator [Alphaproteobacteria bacterium]
MRIIVQKAERQLLDALQSEWQAGQAQRCLHLRFSSFPLQQDLTSDDVLLILSRTLMVFDDIRALRLYRCHDGDVFILARFLTQKNVSLFLSHLAPKLGPASSSLEELAFLYEVQVDWVYLKGLCETKIRVYEEEQARVKNLADQTQVQAHIRKVLDGQIDSVVTHDLVRRRANRTSPEILLVEDDVFTQKLVRNAIQNSYSVSVAGEGLEALRRYIEKAPDVLFLDIGLPDVNGHEILKKIFEIDPSAYVVMLSGNGDRDNVLKAVENGAKGFVGKPFNKTKLSQYIQKSPFIQRKHIKETSYADTIH